MRRMMTMAAAGLILAGCLPALAGGGGLPMAFLGGWEGRGSRSDQPGEWTISADITGGEPGGVVGTIAYPSLGCRGELRLIASSGVVMELAERITQGECVDGGTITLAAQEDGGLRYLWRKEGHPADAEGTLRRRGS